MAILLIDALEQLGAIEVVVEKEITVNGETAYVAPHAKRERDLVLGSGFDFNDQGRLEGLDCAIWESAFNEVYYDAEAEAGEDGDPSEYVSDLLDEFDSIKVIWDKTRGDWDSVVASVKRTREWEVIDINDVIVVS